MRAILAGLFLLTLGGAAASQPVNITIRVLSNQQPVKSGIFSQETGKSAGWFQDTRDNGELSLTRYSCAAGQRFQARPRRPGYIYQDDWEPCRAGVIPFAFARMIYASDIQNARLALIARQPTDERQKRVREVFLTSYDSGNFFALASSSAEMERILTDKNDLTRALNVTTLESLQRGMGSNESLTFNSEKGRYELPKSVTGKLIKWPGALDGSFDAAMIKSIAFDFNAIFAMPDFQ